MSDATVNMEGEGAVTRLGPAVSVATAGDFFSLLKPRVMSLVVFSGLVGMLVAPGKVKPMASTIDVMVEAVPMVLQVPGERVIFASSLIHSGLAMSPAT